VELRDGGTLLFTRTFATGMDAGNALHFQVSTNPSIGPTTTVAATVTQLAGHAVSGAVTQTGNNQESAQNLYLFFPGMSQGFTAQGTVTLTYASLPTGSRVGFKVRAGNIACGATNTPPTVSLTSPANNATFTAPASIVLTADAQDTDGTVAQVEFFQGAVLVATDTTAPFTFTLTNVAAGSYTFTAKATDNLGASTTSAAVNVTVNAAAQLFFIHPDHLNTPRVITNQTAQVVWRWDHAEPFGSNPPNENPSGLGTFTCNLRLPGQYFDKETNLHYNYFRDYDPGIGRYVQSESYDRNWCMALS
jgi:RHS repeat-associated protein